MLRCVSVVLSVSWLGAFVLNNLGYSNGSIPFEGLIGAGAVGICAFYLSVGSFFRRSVFRALSSGAASMGVSMFWLLSLCVYMPFMIGLTGGLSDGPTALGMNTAEYPLKSMSHVAIGTCLVGMMSPWFMFAGIGALDRGIGFNNARHWINSRAKEIDFNYTGVVVANLTLAALAGLVPVTSFLVPGLVLLLNLSVYKSVAQKKAHNVGLKEREPHSV